MISDLWTLEETSNLGTRIPLTQLGVEGATLTRPSQAPGSLTLSFDEKDPGWAWESQWTLRRGEDIIFRGRVATPPGVNFTGRSETVSVELRDVWWDLERTPYTQSWRHVAEGGAEQTRSGRAKIGRSPITGQRETTIQAIADIQEAANQAGVFVAITQAGLSAITPPEIESANRNVAEVLRIVLKWHPSAVAYIESQEEFDVVRIVDRLAMPEEILAAPGGGIEELELTARPDLVVDAVHIYYEAEASESFEQQADPGETPLIRTRRRLAIHKDIFPNGSAITRRSYLGTIPVPTSGGGNDKAPPTPHRVPIVTRPIPPTGSTGKEAEEWWLDNLRLRDAGLTSDDVKLPTSSTDDVQAHRVRFAWEADDDPLNDPERPDPINPNATPLWRPPSVDDLPRQLVSGDLAEWMRVDAAELIVDATIGVRKSTVDNLPPRDNRRVMSFNPVESEIQGVPAYLIDAAIPVTGTSAKTRLYTHWPESGQTLGTATAGSVQASREESVIPGLALRMWNERQVIPYEGSITLTAEEVGDTQWMGRRVSIVTEGNPDWANMRAAIQRETLTIETGITVLDIETPKHLSAKDWSDLNSATRQAHDSAADSGATPPPAIPDDDQEEEDDLGTGGVYPGTVGPSTLPPIIYGQPSSFRQPWDLVPAETPGQFKLIKGTVLVDSDDLQEEITFSGNTTALSPAAGQFIYLRVASPYPTSGSIITGGQWPQFPSAYETSGTAGSTVTLDNYYFPLWRFYSEDGEGDRVKLGENLYGLKLCSHHLRNVGGAFKKIGSPVIVVPSFIPWHRVIPSS